MALSSRVLFTLVAALDLLCGVCGRVIEVDWTPSGVRPFSNTGNPLRTKLGDQLMLRCGQNVSNLFIQTEQIQYDRCDATLGSGMFNFNGFCLPGDLLLLTLSKNSQILENTVNFVNNSVYYLTSYSNGQLASANDASRNSGGQCSDGLRMIIVIGEATLPAPAPAGTVASTIPPSQRPGPNGVSGVSGVSVIGQSDDSDGDNLTLLYTIIPAVAGSIIVVVTAVILTILLIKVCYVKAKTTIHNDPLSHHEPFQCVVDPPNQDKTFYTLVSAEDQSPSQHRLGMITTRSSGTRPNHYVDSNRLPSPRPSTRYSDSCVSGSEVTVNQKIHTPSAYVIKTTDYVTELPVAHSGRRPLRPAPQPPTATYENVEESDLPIYCNSIVDRHEDSQPVTFHPRNAWRQ